MHEAFINMSAHTIYLVMDLVEGEPLKKYVFDMHPSRMPPLIAKSIIKQLIEILKYLHSEEVSVCHRDLNPNNVMIT